MPRRKRNAPPPRWPTETYRAWKPRPGRLVRPREPFVELPGLGFPSAEEVERDRFILVGARRDGRGMQAWREARIRSITWEGWGEHLAGEDIEWALRAVRYLRYILRRREQRVIEAALRAKMGWDAIGAILGVSRQAVAQRWGRLAEQIAREENEARARARGELDDDASVRLDAPEQ